MNYRKENFVYVQFGCHGSFNVYDNDPIPYMSPNHYGENWKVFITEADPSKYEQINRRYGNFPNVFVYNLGIYSDDVPFYALNFEPKVEEVHTLEKTVYQMFIGPHLVSEHNSLEEASNARDQKLQQIKDVSWISQVSSYNVDSILSPNHLSFMPDLANYLSPSPGVKTVTPTKFLTDAGINSIDILFLAQSGCDYNVLSCFPFENVNVQHLAFKSLHVQQMASLESSLQNKGFTREDFWLLDLSHQGYKKL
jgi:hypothetical protein